MVSGRSQQLQISGYLVHKRDRSWGSIGQEKPTHRDLDSPGPMPNTVAEPAWIWVRPLGQNY